MGKITELDLADAQLTGFSQARENPESIVKLIESMGLNRKEWESLKKSNRTRLNKIDFEEVDEHFNAT